MTTQPSTPVLDALYAAIDSVNEGNAPDRQLERSPEAVLMGASSPLDSLGLVSLIVAAEEEIEKRLGIAVTIADERAMSRERSPFRTVGTLAGYLETLIGEQA